MDEKWYKCLECGDVFPTKTPHTHGTQYRKRKIPWEEVEMPESYAALIAQLEREKQRHKSIRSAAAKLLWEMRKLADARLNPFPRGYVDPLAPVRVGACVALSKFRAFCKENP